MYHEVHQLVLRGMQAGQLTEKNHRNIHFAMMQPRDSLV